MKRRVLLLLLLLVAGAIVNVCIAVACGYFKDSPKNKPALLIGPSDEDRLFWRSGKPLGFVQDVVVRAEAQSFGHHTMTLFGDGGGVVHRSDNTLGVDGPWPPPRWESYSVSSFGWPMSIVESSAWSMTTGRKLTNESPSHRPIWPGFAINTVLYAAILCLFFAAPFALRRRRRIKCGLCPQCAYNLRNRPSDSSVCPECGAPTAPTSLSQT